MEKTSDLFDNLEFIENVVKIVARKVGLSDEDKTDFLGHIIIEFKEKIEEYKAKLHGLAGTSARSYIATIVENECRDFYIRNKYGRWQSKSKGSKEKRDKTLDDKIGPEKGKTKENKKQNKPVGNPVEIFEKLFDKKEWPLEEIRRSFINDYNISIVYDFSFKNLETLHKHVDEKIKLASVQRESYVYDDESLQKEWAEILAKEGADPGTLEIIKECTATSMTLDLLEQWAILYPRRRGEIRKLRDSDIQTGFDETIPTRSAVAIEPPPSGSDCFNNSVAMHIKLLMDEFAKKLSDEEKLIFQLHYNECYKILNDDLDDLGNRIKIPEHLVLKIKETKTSKQVFASPEEIQLHFDSLYGDELKLSLREIIISWLKRDDPFQLDEIAQEYLLDEQTVVEVQNELFNIENLEQIKKSRESLGIDEVTYHQFKRKLSYAKGQRISTDANSCKQLKVFIEILIPVDYEVDLKPVLIMNSKNDDGLKISEIAKRLGKSRYYVEKTIKKTISCLKEYLNEMGVSDDLVEDFLKSDYDYQFDLLKKDIPSVEHSKTTQQ